MAKRVGLVFAGQGAQFVGMGKDLAAASPAASALFEQADHALGRDLSRICFEGPAADLTASANCQPAIYTVSLACLAALRERVPMEPAVCAGLSLGEFAALTAADALDFETGLRLVARRGELMDAACRATQGAMAAVLNAEPRLVDELCAEHGVDVANYNCPGQVVISGPAAAVEETAEALRQAGVSRVIMLQVAGAFHSRLMATAAQAFEPVLATTGIQAPTCPVAQNAAGTLVTDPAEIRRNLARQVAGSVRWENCVRAMLETGIDFLVELGPGKVLSGFMRRISGGFPTSNVAGADDIESAVAALGE